MLLKSVELQLSIGTLYILYIELEVNLLEATHSKDREREGCFYHRYIGHFVYLVEVYHGIIEREQAKQHFTRIDFFCYDFSVDLVSIRL